MQEENWKREASENANKYLLINSILKGGKKPLTLEDALMYSAIKNTKPYYLLTKEEKAASNRGNGKIMIVGGIIVALFSLFVFSLADYIGYACLVSGGVLFLMGVIYILSANKLQNEVDEQKKLETIKRQKELEEQNRKRELEIIKIAKFNEAMNQLEKFYDNIKRVIYMSESFEELFESSKNLLLKFGTNYSSSKDIDIICSYENYSIGFKFLFNGVVDYKTIIEYQNLIKEKNISLLCIMSKNGYTDKVSYLFNENELDGILLCDRDMLCECICTLNEDFHEKYILISNDENNIIIDNILENKEELTVYETTDNTQKVFNESIEKIPIYVDGNYIHIGSSVMHICGVKNIKLNNNKITFELFGTKYLLNYINNENAVKTYASILSTLEKNNNEENQ